MGLYGIIKVSGRAIGMGLYEISEVIYRASEGENAWVYGPGFTAGPPVDMSGGFYNQVCFW